MGSQSDPSGFYATAKRSEYIAHIAYLMLYFCAIASWQEVQDSHYYSYLYDGRTISPDPTTVIANSSNISN